MVAALTGAPCLALDTIYLTRHAEKAAIWPDEVDEYRPLSPPGAQRAERLAALLAGTGIVAIYTSPTTRALATGMPLAEGRKVPISATSDTIAADRQEAFLASLKQRHPGHGAVLIVGHSDTVPRLLILLGAEASCYQRLGIVATPHGPGIEGYDGLWRVDLTREGCARITRRSQEGGPARTR